MLIVKGKVKSPRHLLFSLNTSAGECENALHGVCNLCDGFSDKRIVQVVWILFESELWHEFAPFSLLFSLRVGTDFDCHPPTLKNTLIECSWLFSTWFLPFSHNLHYSMFCISRIANVLAVGVAFGPVKVWQVSTV